MAKRADSDDKFVMAVEIRNLLRGNRAMTGREVVDALREKFPKQTINPNSCSVAYAHARRDLKIRSVRRKKPGVSAADRPGRKSAGARKSAGGYSLASAQPGIELLKAAKALLQHCQGDSSLAAAAVRQVSELQME